MSFSRTLGTILAALLALPSCDWKSDGAARLEELYPTAADAGPTPPPPDPCPLPDDAAAAAVPATGTCTDLTHGRWAARLIQYGSMSPVGSPWNIRLTDHFIAVPAADKKALELTFCAQLSNLVKPDGTPVELGKTSMPDKTKQAIAKIALPLPLPGDGTFQAADVAWLWGVQGLANPVTDALPTLPTDPTVWDQDEDGNPGVTVEVKNPDGQRYMARRSRWTFGKATVSSEWITGPLTFAVHENALGANNNLLKTVAPITPRGECQSVYQLRCVEESFGCDQVLANATALWRDAPK